MQSQKTKKQVIDYYTRAEIDYRLVWHLGSQMAMHFGFWDSDTRTLRRALQNENRVLAKMAHISADDRALDAGCGVGGSSLYLAREVGCHVTGITIVPKQVERAQATAKARGLADKVHFELADFIATGFPAASFDVVWAIESVCHADNKRAFLDEAYRLLKPGGRLIVADGFASKATYAEGETTIMQAWLNGWGVGQLDTVKRFVLSARRAGFSDAVAHDFTAAVMPSSRRLYNLWRLARPLDTLTRLLGLRSEITKGNFEATRYQYEALARGLAGYSVITGSKSAKRA